MSPDLQALLRDWRLGPDGPLRDSGHAKLLPVRRDGAAMMLKWTEELAELRGFEQLQAWQGGGAVPVLARRGNALLMARASGGQDLAHMARAGQDEAALRLLCRQAQRLHRVAPPPGLLPLAEWFAELWPMAEAHPVLAESRDMARALLARAEAPVSLHGDLHHGNLLDFNGAWLVIDPKGLIGPAEFDFAVMFANPDLDDPSQPVAVLPGRCDARLALVARETGFAPQHLLRWILAWSGLSAAWFMGDAQVDHDRLAVDLHVMAWASARLRDQSPA